MTTIEFFERHPTDDPYAVEMSKRYATMDEVWQHCEPGMVFWIATQPGVVDDATFDRMCQILLRVDMPGMQAIDTIMRLGQALYMPFVRTAGQWLRDNAKPNWGAA